MEILEKQTLNSDEFDSNFGLLSFVYLPSSSQDNELGASSSQGYQAKVRLQHSYFLATILNFRGTMHFSFDVCLIIASLLFFFGAMTLLVNKGQVSNYHQGWVIGDPNYA